MWIYWSKTRGGHEDEQGRWNIFPMETGWACSAWGREGSREILQHFPVPKGAARELGEGILQGHWVIGQGGNMFKLKDVLGGNPLLWSC